MTAACGATSPARWLCALGQALPAVLLLLLNSPVLGQVPRSLPVKKITLQHIGQPAASDALIRANIRLKQGDTYSRKASDDDIHNLRNTGFFENVYVTEKQVAGGFEITYTLVGKPVVTEILFEGNSGGRKFREGKLRKKIRSRTGETLSRPRIFADTRALLKEYQKGGYQQATVDYEVRHDEALGQATVVFQIEPGPKVKIDDIVFANALAFSQRELRKVLKTRRKWFMSWLTGSGKFETDQWEEDLERLTQFYQDEGYIDFEVREIDFSDPSDGGMVIRLDLYEGYRYQVGSVAFEGNTLFTDDQIRRGVQVIERAVIPLMLEGAIFTPTGFNEDRDAIRDFYEAHGYLDTIVRTTRVPNTDRGTIDLVYTIQEGELSYVEKVEIRGNTRTRDKVVRRELAISPGEVFDMVRVELSKRRLQGTTLFDSVETQVEKIPELPNRRNLIIGVEEGRTGRFLMGFGYSSIEAMFAQVGFVQGNFDLFNPPFFTGGGQKFRLNVTAGTRRQDYQITFEEPWFLDQKKRVSVDLYHREIQYFSRYFEQRQTGTRLGYSQRIFNDRISAGGNYTIESIGIHDRSYFSDMLSEHDMLINGLAKGYPDGLSANPFDWTYDTDRIQEGELSELNHNRLVSKLGLFLSHETLNNALLPSGGHLTRVNAEIAGGPFGGDTEMYRLEINSAHYFRGFGEGHILEVYGELGVVDTFGDSRRVPYFDRFFLGGGRTLRGHDYRDIGPRMQTWKSGVENDQFGYYVNVENEAGEAVGQKFVPVKQSYIENPFHKIPEIAPDGKNRWTPVTTDSFETLGGSSYWLGSVEYSIPIIPKLRFAVFYDIGMVYEDPYEFEFSNYADNWGIGLRLVVPMLGPLRLDYGIPITQPDYADGGGEFHFGVGFTRNF
ncbi:MAG: outer membrane protein assembly factor BamA [Verrucomicrobiales bacterium]|jgi:outer membrane protein insertion porin family|nr:outer membrane protein assembly factor BamA [Verrucomicrobiales bacterium]MDP6679442.1 outer membrane protein assembly factor BamA [Verrucomicrobiota bacterium]MDP6753963.1 outer membrane protein assembly factor BamA [Verrucomicrobiota bacterium]MDP7013482.1 outer membrane protein assembly factor BamA [Verrucomicrobiota bacterium]